MAAPGWNVYFAYGSNLHLQQMAYRCPESRYLGTGRLYGFRWQINERGYANVVADEDSFVDGICYLLNTEDEYTLDLNEGVDFGAYEKELLNVEVICRPVIFVGRDVGMITSDDRYLDTGSSGSELGESGTSTRTNNSLHLERGGEEVQALVYLSTTYTTAGNPWKEYIGRIECGIKDSIALGISEDYTNNMMRPWLSSPKEKK